MKSFWPVTVTACGTLQSAAVKTSGFVDVTWPSVGSPEETVIDTVVTGSLFSTTKNCAVPPPSVVTRPAVGLTLIPARSASSTLVIGTSATLIPLYSRSVELAVVTME
jgi:hypothetical protein